MTRSPSPVPLGDADDPELRDLLHDAVADVEPTPRLEEVLRAAHDGRRRTTWPLLLVAAATAAVVAVGVGLWLPRSGPPADPPPAASPAPSEGPSLLMTDRTNVPVYYLGGDAEPRLFREFPFVDAHGSLDLPALAVDAMLTLAPSDPDYRSPWPEGTRAGVGYDADRWEVVVANDEVDLVERPGWLSPREAELAVQQLIYTVQAAAGDAERHPVEVRVEGAAAAEEGRTTVLGVPVEVPVVREPMRSALAPVWIVEPADGSRQRTITVSGVTNRPLPFVAWQVTDGRGTIVDSGRAAVSAEAVGATYSFTVDGLPSGTYTVTVTRGRAPRGAGPGTGVAGDLVDTKEVTVP
ncbi:MAG TPA: GerMN domain-containing protein [Microthrixaceae bacterium]|nr:GerMN domain-containing protein [Microthrixaceae bacterium]